MSVRSCRQREVEERWGMPFWELVGDFAGQGLSMAATARALGYHKDAFHKLLQVSGHRSLWPRRASLPVQYVADTGESFRAACERLAATTHMREAARQLGFASCQNLRLAMTARGIDVKFQPYRRPVVEAAEPELTRITADEVDEYIRRRLDGQPCWRAAAAMDRSRCALWLAVKRVRPEAVPELIRMGRISKRRTRQSLKALIWSNNQ